ncbi:unnamed protein product [Caenorhabditis auriculariae]|uniref:Uncharacterized protein n=1 Tax=Caenorhabditis auriculariae TaxID=2777116 RepID=A0A8S1HJ57_9PELO|nr:unnamed protein product [Caenorhabditis auriculariae]
MALEGSDGVEKVEPILDLKKSNKYYPERKKKGGFQPALWHGDIRVEHDLGHSFRRGDLSRSEPLSGTSVQPRRLVHCPTPPCSCSQVKVMLLKYLLPCCDEIGRENLTGLDFCKSS